MSWLSQQRYEAEFKAETAAFAEAVARQDLGATVPTCPEWTFHDMIVHVGSGHRWATELIASGAQTPAPINRVEPPADWAQWLVLGARLLTEAVRWRGFDQRVWTWQPTAPTAGFWLRRMLHDEIVHRLDADPAGDLVADLAADGVADLLATIATLSRLTGHPLGMRLRGDGETLQFRATDGAGAWHATLTPAGVDWQAGEAPADETIEAPARELLLLLNRRVPPADPGPLFTRWLAATRF